MTVKQSGSYPISSEDIHWANHTENQQHTSENRDYNELCEIWISELFVAMIWNKKAAIRNWSKHDG